MLESFSLSKTLFSKSIPTIFSFKNGTVTVHDLSQKFNVSYETIRKDLNYLSEKDQLVKSHGGAVSNQNSIENPFTIKGKRILAGNRVLQKEL